MEAVRLETPIQFNNQSPSTPSIGPVTTTMILDDQESCFQRPKRTNPTVLNANNVMATSTAQTSNPIPPHAERAMNPKGYFHRSL